MPVPTLISELSQTAASNSPAGSESPSTLDNYQRAYASFVAQLRDGAGYTAEATVASAATADIGAATSFYVQITGTTTITSFGTAYNGPRFVRFAGALTLTHNATTLILPGAANITTAAGDTAVVVPTGNAAAGWRVVSYQRASGLPFSSTPPAGLRNKIINGNFAVNQRSVSGSSTAYASGVYVLDRWKAGSGGCTMSFATVDNVTTATITAGTLVQVVEGLNLQSGTHALSWAGTATARIDAGSYSASGVTGTATGGTNLSIEFGTGTVSQVQLEPGSSATTFELRPYGVELALCQRYYVAGAADNQWSGNTNSGSTYYARTMFPVYMRASPTVALSNSAALGFPVAPGSAGGVGVSGFESSRTANATTNGAYFYNSWTATAEL